MVGNQQITDVRSRPKPIVLLILDGWVMSPTWRGNAIISTKTPTFDYLWKHYPHTVLQSFKLLGNESGQIRSSEIGHASIGAGRIVKDDLTELNSAIESGQFFDNAVLQTAMERAKQTGKVLHLIGLLSEGGIQGSLQHAIALVRMAKQCGVKELCLHPITDGFDVPSGTAQGYLKTLEEALSIEGLGKIVTILGRSYAMNQDENWQQTAVAYQALLYGDGRSATSVEDAMQSVMANKVADSDILPTVINDQREKGPYISGRIRPGDVVISWNFRYDGIQQLTRAFLDPSAMRSWIITRRYPLSKVAQFVGLTDYRLILPSLMTAFPAAQLTNTLPQLLETHNLTQLRVAEAIKYSHISYFFNGGILEPSSHETRIIVPSKRVKTYALAPQMSAGQITTTLEKNIRSRSHDVIIANLANVDVVSKTGDILATSKAIQAVDEAMRRIANATIDADGVLIITADHGNTDQFRNESNLGQSHMVTPLPFIMVANNLKYSPQVGSIEINDVIATMIRSHHSLADVAPTILELLGIAKPSDMTGQSLLADISTR